MTARSCLGSCCDGGSHSGAAMSLGALYVATHQAGVYWTQFNVVLLAPIEGHYPNQPRRSSVRPGANGGGTGHRLESG
jgi:hypothetical protein